MIRIRFNSFPQKALAGLCGFIVGAVVVVLGVLAGHEVLASTGAGIAAFCSGFALGACD